MHYRLYRIVLHVGVKSRFQVPTLLKEAQGSKQGRKEGMNGGFGFSLLFLKECMSNLPFT
jgi:hypothetical protein